MELIVASYNRHKVRELRDILKMLERIEVLSLQQLRERPELPKSDDPDPANRAAHCATLLARKLNSWVLADLTRLTIPALEDRPEQAVFFEPDTDHLDPNCTGRLLAEMSGLTGFQRAAALECYLALADSNGLIRCVTAVCEGMIASSERGRNGYCYDSLFYKYDYDKTFAELDQGVKNRVSHRRKAMDKLLGTLERLLLTEKLAAAGA